MMNESEHSIFPPSSMDRLVNCPGSFLMTQMYPEPTDTPAAMEGTAAHWVCAELAVGNRVEIGQLAPNGIAITDEMIEGAEMFVDQIPASMMPPWGAMKQFYVEKRVDIPRVHELCWGTPDVRYHIDKRITILDYKFGHAYVDVFENYQLMAYAAGALDAVGGSDLDVVFDLTIVQPRCFHRDGPVRTWTVLASEIRGHINRMQNVCGALSSRPDDAQCSTGEHCKYCPANHACDALQRSTQSVLDFMAKPIPSDMPPGEKGLYLSRVQKAIVLLKAIGDGLEQEVEASIRRGVPVHGYDLQPGQGRTTWTRPQGEIEALGDMLGADFRKHSLITPKQAQATLKKIGIDGSVITEYSGVSSGELKLVASDSSLTRRVFGQLTKE
jgi:hypothetical protein